MRIYDISQKIFGCDVYPGDPKPERKELLSIKNGDACNLTSFSMCAHNGTHIDAPCHFIDGGAGVDKIPLFKTVGYAYVAEMNGDISADDAQRIVEKASLINFEASKRILIKGKAVITYEAALVFCQSGVYLLGNESQTVGPFDAPAKVHNLLLGKETVLLEGVRLTDVKEGVYFLSCAPLNLENADGSPCRAILIEL